MSDTPRQGEITTPADLGGDAVAALTKCLQLIVPSLTDHRNVARTVLLMLKARHFRLEKHEPPKRR